MLKSELIRYRDGRAGDLPFIYSTWLKGLYYGNDWFRSIDQERYFDMYHHAIERLLTGGAEVRVACLYDDPDVVLGYCVSKGPILHWVFVKTAWRKIGIAKKLVPEGITACTHLTAVGKSIKPATWKFDPFLL